MKNDKFSNKEGNLRNTEAMKTSEFQYNATKNDAQRTERPSREAFELAQAAVREILDSSRLVLSPEERIATIPGWDSVATVQILLLLERWENVEFETLDVANLKTAGDLAALLDKANRCA